MKETKMRDIFICLIAGILIGLVIAMVIYKTDSIKPEIRYDVNGDGVVTPYDAVKVINYYLDQGQ